MQGCGRRQEVADRHRLVFATLLQLGLGFIYTFIYIHTYICKIYIHMFTYFYIWGLGLRIEVPPPCPLRARDRRRPSEYLVQGLGFEEKELSSLRFGVEGSGFRV